MNGKRVWLLAGGLAAAIALSTAVGCGREPPIAERSGTGGRPISPVDPYTRGQGHWVFESEGGEMGHGWGERVLDPGASGAAAWGTPTGPHARVGTFVFGPYYRRLPAGKYRVDFHLRIEQAEAMPAALLDVYVDKDIVGKTVARTLAKRSIGENTGANYRAFPVDFELPRDLVGAGVEFRVRVTDPAAQVRADRAEVWTR